MIPDYEHTASARALRRGIIGTHLSPAGVAVAAVVIASLVIPSPDRVTPRVPALSDSHAVRTSVSDEPVSQLAALSMITPFRR